MGRYPHQLSGGMQQRVIIAMALATDPALLILDEPTTGLDATVEAEVLDLVAGLQAEFHTSVLFISHNLGIIQKMCDRVGVLYAGRLVEEGTTEPCSTIRVIPTPWDCSAVFRAAVSGRITGASTRFPASCRTSVTSSPAACSRVAAPWPRLAVTSEEPDAHVVGRGHLSRCHFHDRAQTLPREYSADLVLPESTVGRAALRFDDSARCSPREGTSPCALARSSHSLDHRVSSPCSSGRHIRDRHRRPRPPRCGDESTLLIDNAGIGTGTVGPRFRRPQ